MVALGIDIGGSSVKLAAADGGQTLFTTQSQTYEEPTRQQLASEIRKALAGRFTGGPVGICVPGARDRMRRVVINSVNIPALNELSLDELVAEAVGFVPVHVEIASDAVANAYDIYTSAKMRGRLCALALGTGVGAAVIDEGPSVLYVHGESPGHIGQMDVSVAGDEVIGPDGGRGSLEGYIGVPALVKRYGVEVTEILQRLSAEDVPLVALARAIRICHAIYCPDHVALSGGLGIRMQHLLGTIRELVERDLTRIAQPNWTLTCGVDDFHAARGVAKMAAAGLAKTG
jgi:predicted NBD/HSP70 family sugar kinase